MTTTLIEYSRNIAPIVRNLAKQKELLADFKASDAKYIELTEEVKELQDAMKAYLEGTDDGKEILDEIKDISNDLKQAVAAAAQGSVYKAAELKQFFITRAKDEGVEKVVTKGELFDELDNLLK